MEYLGRALSASGDITTELNRWLGTALERVWKHSTFSVGNDAALHSPTEKIGCFASWLSAQFFWHLPHDHTNLGPCSRPHAVMQRCVLNNANVELRQIQDNRRRGHPRRCWPTELSRNLLVTLIPLIGRGSSALCTIVFGDWHLLPFISFHCPCGKRGFLTSSLTQCPSLCCPSSSRCMTAACNRSA